MTVEQHREMVRLGIKARKDGTFGFKLRCNRRGCDRLIKTTCYCEETVGEAIRRVTEDRSIYTCSRRCWWLSGSMADFFQEGYQDGIDHFVSRARLKKHRINFRKAGWEKVVLASPSLYRDFNKFVDTWDLDGDGDEGECSCEL